MSLAVYSVALVAAPGPRKAPASAPPARIHLNHQDVALLLSGEKPWEWPGQVKQVTRQGETFTLKSTLDPVLQSHMKEKLDTRYSPIVALAAVDPDTGGVLALAAAGQGVNGPNPCLLADYPAASVFKVVTAAAAVEAHDLSCEELIAYRGDAHTLYRSQLKRKERRRSNNATLEEAFARSINPVFGKIGIYLLGQDRLSEKAASFGFGQDLGPEICAAPSRAPIPEDDYGLAECASGFNRQTQISPLHGALLAATAVNGGLLLSPGLVESVYSANGTRLYSREPEILSVACTPQTAERLGKLMEATVSEGTARKAFRRSNRDPNLAGLVMGGKTGTISNGAPDKDERLLYDWFVGFAHRPEDGKKIAVACVVVHGKIRGTKASRYARMAFSEYFKNHQPG